MATKLRDVAALAEAAGGNRIKFETLVGEEITIFGVIWEHGSYGDYAVLTFSHPGSKKKEETSTGAEQVVNVIKVAENKHLFPFTAEVRSYESKKFKGKSAYALA